MERKAIAARSDLEHMLVDEAAEPKALQLSLLEDITGDFSDDQEIGRGGFAVVYKGMLGDRAVAVKRLSNAHMHEKQFHREVECLMRVKHKNVVRFLGYCADTQGNMAKYNGKLVMADVQQRLLCFEYIPKGSLDKYITDASREWGTCYKIIKGICEGLQYLHENQIVHLDLKPANILLGHNMVPKITDFGLSRCFDENQSRHITKNITGTIGYLAPELRDAGVIARTTDMYSLGVIIIEILTGQKGYQEIWDVLESWSDRLEISRRDTLCKQIRECYDTALKCIAFNPEERPASAQKIIDRLHQMELESIQGHESQDTSRSGYCSTDSQSQRSGCGLASPGGQGVSSIVSRDLFERLLPHRNDAACPARGFYTYDAFIAAAAAFPSFGTTGSTETRKQEVAAFFAQTSYETSGGWPTAPDGPFSWGYCFKQEKDPMSCYCVPVPEWPCAPGKQYYGRGPIQLSYNYNYGPAGRAIGVDLLNNPDLVATDPVVSFKTALWFWITANGNKPSCHAVMTASGYQQPRTLRPAGCPAGYGVITNIINGGIECRREPNPMVADRTGFYKHTTATSSTLATSTATTKGRSDTQTSVLSSNATTVLIFFQKRQG